MEVFARTIEGISTKSESESVSVENSAKSDIGPFCANNWWRFRQEIEVDLSSTLDCWLSPLFGERKSISDQAPISRDIGLLYFQFNIWKFNSSSIYELFFLNLWDKNKFSFIESQALSRDPNFFLQLLNFLNLQPYHMFHFNLDWFLDEIKKLNKHQMPISKFGPLTSFDWYVFPFDSKNYLWETFKAESSMKN